MYQVFRDASKFSELMPGTNDNTTLRIFHGDVIGNLFLPFIREDRIDSLISTMTNLFVKLIKDTFSNGNFTLIVSIQMYQQKKNHGKPTLEPIYQGEQVGSGNGFRPPCYMFKLHLEEEIPSEHEIQVVMHLVTWFLTQCKGSRRLLFAIGCQQGLNRTGFMICSLMIRLFGMDVESSLRLFRKAHYPGIVKQHFIDQLYVNHPQTKQPSMFLRMPLAMSIDNLIHRTLNAKQRKDFLKRLDTKPKDRGIVRYECGKQSPMVQWNGKKVSVNLYAYIYSSLIPLMLRTIGKNIPSSGIREVDIQRVRNGLVRPVPCSERELEKHEYDVLHDFLVSIKANGRHATLLATWMGTFVIERNEVQGVISSVCMPFLKSLTGEPVPFTAIECELVEKPDGTMLFFCFDIIHQDGSTVCTKPFGERQRMLEALLENNPNPMLFHKKFYPVTSQLLASIANNQLSEHFHPLLCEKDGNDGFIFSRKSADVMCSNVPGPHIKLKSMHTVDFFISATSQENITMCFSKNGDILDTVANMGSFNGKNYDSTCIAKDYQLLLDPGYYECECIVTEKTFGFRHYKKRMDIVKPNHINTIMSCLNLTENGFYIDDFRKFCRDLSLKRKREEL